MSLFLVLALAAAPLLGPEVPLVPGVAQRLAAYDQTAPAAASNGDDYLVAWVDGRRLGSDIYVTRVRANGQPVEPLGRRIAAGTNPKIASAGGDYVLVWRAASGVQSIRLSADGAPLSAPHAIGSGEPVLLVSNGSTYLLVTRPDSSATVSSAMVLDRDGVLLRSVARTFAVTAGAAGYAGQYFLVDAASSVVLHSIAQDGVVADQVLQPFANASYGQLTAVLAPGTVLLAWSSGSYMVADYSGNLRTIFTQLPVPSIQFPAVAAGWDGRDFAMMIYSSAGTVTPATVFRFSFQGALLGSALTLPTLGTMNGVTFASSPAAQLIVWSEKREFTSEVVALATPAISALTATSAATVLSYSGEAQGDVQIARGPRGVLAAWDDADRWLRVSASFNGGPPAILESTPGPDYVGWPAVMTGQHVFLVVWRHAGLNDGPVKGSDRLLAKRFDFDGKDLDPEPLILMNEDRAANLFDLQHNPQTPSIAFDGAAFWVVWTEKNALYTIRVPESGSAIEERETALGNFAANARSPRALWTGNELLIGYTPENGPTVIGTPTWSDLATVRFDRSGTALSQLPPQPAASFIGYGVVRISATLAPDAITFAWIDTRLSSRRDIVTMQTTLDGRAKVNPTVVVSRAESEVASAEIVWNGSEYVLAWTEGVGIVKAVRLDANLRRIDSVPFEVSPGPGPLLPPWLITTPSGVLIAYSRADDANGGAPRLFMRALARQPVTRHRAVGR